MTLSRADLLVELGRFLSSIDGLMLEAERHFRAALEAEPKAGRALAGLGSLRAAERKYAEAEPFFAQAMEADPRDPELALLYAEALLQNEIGPFAETEELPADAAPRLQHAREVAQRALTLICGDCTAGEASRGALAGRAYGDLGTSYLADADFRPGITLLERAHELLPARHDYTLHLLALERRAGEQAKADALFAGLAGAHNAQLAFAARNVVVREELQRANTLIREQKLDEGVKVLRALAAESPDADARADLERQAAEVARVAATNREIVLYNRAVGEANSGKRAAAIKTLEELLRVAKDPQVIADATKLRTQLAKRHG
jgi:tetratricopeptide (TPR) repeat protein